MFGGWRLLSSTDLVTRSERADDRGEAIDGVVDVLDRSPAAETESDRRAAVRPDGADGLQHVRRLVASGAACGSRRDGKIADRHQERFPFDPLEADVQVVRQAALERSVDAHALDVRAQSGKEAIPESLVPRALI